MGDVVCQKKFNKCAMKANLTNLKGPTEHEPGERTLRTLTASPPMKTKASIKTAAPAAERKEQKATQNGAVAADLFKIKTIIVPMDFSPLAKKALAYAVPFAKKHGAKLLLVHAVEPVLYPENFIGAIPPEVEDSSGAIKGVTS
jgi:hypothetical protein